VRIIKTMRRQKAVLWKKGAVNHYGKTDWQAPIEILCRWDDVVTEFRTSTGDIWASAATIYPDVELTPGDMVMRGELSESTPIDPTGSSALRVRKFDRIPNLKATAFLHIAYLM
jgi:hypothetical protein